MGEQEFTQLDARTFYKATIMETIQGNGKLGNVDLKQTNKQKNRTTTTGKTHFLKHHRIKKVMRSSQTKIWESTGIQKV